MLLIRHALKHGLSQSHPTGNKPSVVQELKIILVQMSKIEDVLVGSLDWKKLQTPSVMKVFASIFILAEIHLSSPAQTTTSSWFASQMSWLIGFAICLDAHTPAQLECRPSLNSNCLQREIARNAPATAIIVGWMARCLARIGAFHSKSGYSPASPHLVFWSNAFERNLESVARDKRLLSVLQGLSAEAGFCTERHRFLNEFDTLGFIGVPSRESLKQSMACYEPFCFSMQWSEFLTCPSTIPASKFVDLIIVSVESSLCLAAAADANRLRSTERSSAAVDAKKLQLIRYLLNLFMALWCSAILDHSSSSSTRKQLIKILDRFGAEQLLASEWRKKANLLALALYARHLEGLCYESPVMHQIKPLLRLDFKCQVRRQYSSCTNRVK